MKLYESRPVYPVEKMSDEDVLRNYQMYRDLYVEEAVRLAGYIEIDFKKPQKTRRGWMRYYAAIMDQFATEIHKRGIDGYQNT